MAIALIKMMMTTIAMIIIEELIPSLLLSHIIKSAALQRGSCEVQFFVKIKFFFFANFQACFWKQCTVL